jgi:hypothetical protein
VTRDGRWFVAEVSGLRAFTGGNSAVVTQGRDLDELAFMVRDAIELPTDERDFDIQLLLPRALKLPARRGASPAARKRVRMVA